MIAINGLWMKAVLLSLWANIVRMLGWVYGSHQPLPSVLRAQRRSVFARIDHARYVRDLIRMRLRVMRAEESTLSESVYLANVYDIAEKRLHDLRTREAEITGDLVLQSAKVRDVV